MKTLLGSGLLLLLMILAGILLATDYKSTEPVFAIPTDTFLEKSACIDTENCDENAIEEAPFFLGEQTETISEEAALKTPPEPAPAILTETFFEKSACTDAENSGENAAEEAPFFLSEKTETISEEAALKILPDHGLVNKCIEVEGLRPLHNCSENGTCIFDDTVEPCFRCECKEGFASQDLTYIGTNCTDIDECAGLDLDKETGELVRLHNCHPKAICKNTVGGYECVCKEGFEDSKEAFPGKHCEDINECIEQKPCSEFATCENKVGYYVCKCFEEFIDQDPEHPGIKCELVQRFSLDVECDGLPHETCVEKTKKIFEDYCAINDDERCKNYKIVDFDECSSSVNKCPDDAKCVNTPGGYTCECKDGYEYVEASELCERKPV